MPSKSSSSKSPKPSDEATPEAEANIDSAKPKKATKGKVLSLIEEEKPKTRVRSKESTVLPPLGATKKPAVEEPKKEEPAAPAKPTLDEQKAAALNLFEDDEKPKKRVRPADAVQQTALPPISLLKEDTTPKPIIPIVHAPPADVPKPEFEVNESGEKIIHLKPPIVVKDLADKMGLKPFKVISDLIAFKVFASADKAIDIEIAEKICEKHGFK
ncbi:MAG: translation initiation factor IF-2 N-terminal domain-containing protein, partial [Prosthecobacter sp.]|uniref:translation initiation factor IF-2 N-terminal domain-containing protein n=1 Tax=Prosthecobacter sp. TaxID=1965333 RepID=UPI0019FD8D62